MEKEKINVLLADDYPIIISGITIQIREMDNIEVIGSAENGKEIVSLVDKLISANKKIDLILMDIEMPEMNGIDATKIILKKYPYIKIAALTIYENVQIISKMNDVGAVGYILKSIKQNELEIAINKLVNGENYYSKDLYRILKTELSDIGDITDTELEVLNLIANGYTIKQIAKMLFITESAVNRHRESLADKTKTKNKNDLIKYAHKHNLVKDYISLSHRKNKYDNQEISDIKSICVTKKTILDCFNKIKKFLGF